MGTSVSWSQELSSNECRSCHQMSAEPKTKTKQPFGSQSFSDFEIVIKPVLSKILQAEELSQRETHFCDPGTLC